MCRASNDPKGPKRCLKHAKVSQYVVRSAMTKFGVDERTAAQSLSELNREGKHLPEASGAEALAFVEQEKFIVSSDQDLSDHERKIQLNQLAKASTEVKSGVSGSHLYAWKNLASRVASKLRKLAYVGLLVPGLALAGCSAGHITTPSTGTSASSQPGTSQTSTPRPSTSTSTPASNAKTIAGNGQKVTDKYGTYEHAAPVKATIDSSTEIASSVKKVGFTDEQLKSAEDFISNFVSTQTIDSTAVDGGSASYDAWVKANKGKYLVAANADQLVAGHDGQEAALIFHTAPKGTLFTRDGGVRIASEKLFIDSVEGYDDVYKRLQVGGTANVQYRVSSEASIAALKAAHPGTSEADLKAKFPKAFNGTDDVLKFDLTYLYSITPDGDSWKIGGYSNQYHTEYSYK